MAQGKRCNLSKTELEDLYVKQKLSMEEIGEKLGVCCATVLNHLRRFDITSRTPGESLRTDLSGIEVGDWLVTDEKKWDGPKKHLRWKCLCRLCNTYHWILARSLYTQTSTKCLKCRRRLHRKGFEKLNGTHWGKILWGAETRDIPVEITPEYAWSQFEEQNGKCALSGMTIALGYKSESTASLDRKDNKKGYVEGNVQWVHKDINRMKWAHTEEEFIKLCLSVATHTMDRME